MSVALTPSRPSAREVKLSLRTTVPDRPRRLLRPGLVRLGKGNSPLKHIICIMDENQVMPRMLGCYQGIYPGFRGVDPDPSRRRFNEDLDGRRYYQRETTWRQPPIDPEHSMQDTALQMSHRAMGDMAGFIANFHQHYPESTPEQRQNVMDFFPHGFLPATHLLADHGMIFDNWHADGPFPTWPNRWMHLAGTCNGYVNMPEGSPVKKYAFENWFLKNNPTLFSQLADAGIDFRCYYHDVPISWLLKRNRHPEVAQHYYQFASQFFADMKRPEHELPFLLYVEPCYQGQYQNDNHPPQDIMKGEYLLAEIYNAVRANEELWNSCAILVLYDEHGGFYDDMFPPAAVPPDSQAPEYPCNQLGLRTPTMLISPLVPRGFDPRLYQNTSFNRFIEEHFGLEPLSARTASANSFADLFTQLDAPRTDWPEKITFTPEQLEPPDKELDAKTCSEINHLNQAMLHLGDYIGLYGVPNTYSRFARAYVRASEFWRTRVLRRKPAAAGLGDYSKLVAKCDVHAEQSRRVAAGEKPRALRRFEKYGA